MYIVYEDSNMIQKVDQCLFIPKDEGNKDYQDFLRWVEDGGVAEVQKMFNIEE